MQQEHIVNNRGVFEMNATDAHYNYYTTPWESNLHLVVKLWESIPLYKILGMYFVEWWEWMSRRSQALDHFLVLLQSVATLN